MIYDVENTKTTISISKETKDRLEKLKIHPREPYEDVLKRLLENASLFPELIPKEHSD